METMEALELAKKLSDEDLWEIILMMRKMVREDIEKEQE